MPGPHVRENFNLKKIAVLRALANNGPLTPVDLAVRTRRYPVRAMYSYMLRLAKWGLVTRGRRIRRGRMLYQLTEKGKHRLAYLLGSRSQSIPGQHRAISPADTGG